MTRPDGNKLARGIAPFILPLALVAIVFAAPPWTNQAAAADEKYQCSNSSGYYDTKADCETVCPSGVCTAVAGQSVKTETPISSSTEMKKSYPLENPLAAASIPEAIGRATRIFIGISGSLALLAFVWGGLLMLISGGKEESVRKGKQILVMATVGLAIVFGSYALLKVFMSVFGLT